MPGVFQDIGGLSTGLMGIKTRAPLQDAGGGGIGTKHETTKIAGQEAVKKLAPIPSLQVITRFNLRLAMNLAEEITGAVVPLTVAVRHFFLTYHLKGV